MSDTRTCANCLSSRISKRAGSHELVCRHPSRCCGRVVDVSDTCDRWRERNDYYIIGRRGSA